MFARPIPLLRALCAAVVLSALVSPGAAMPPPNEAGAIPILMYHSIGERGAGGRRRYDRHGLNIAPATFYRHLCLMHKAGWYPINMRDATSPRMIVPAGKTPVVLTFDDARGSQFRYLPDGRIDPRCAVGILQRFSASHADWPLRATFYVLPRSRYNPTPFWQPRREKSKLRWLVRSGFEVANHSTSHGWMNRMSWERIQREVARAVRLIQRVAPGATMDTFAVPYGAMPRTRSLLEAAAQGRQAGTTYRNRVVLMAWGGPSYPPTHRRYDRLAVPRIGAAPGEVEAAIRRLSRGRPPRFISDGDPYVVTVPAAAAKYISTSRLAGARLVVVPRAASLRRRPAREAPPARLAATSAKVRPGANRHAPR